MNMVRKDLGKLWEWLPEGALYQDQNAYYKQKQGKKNNEPDALRPIRIKDGLAEVWITTG
jgi:hypothetical protein